MDNENDTYNLKNMIFKFSTQNGVRPLIFIFSKTIFNYIKQNLNMMLPCIGS
jgi:hypothetical protein